MTAMLTIIVWFHGQEWTYGVSVRVPAPAIPGTPWVTQ